MYIYVVADIVYMVVLLQYNQSYFRNGSNSYNYVMFLFIICNYNRRTDIYIIST